MHKSYAEIGRIKRNGRDWKYCYLNLPKKESAEKEATSARILMAAELRKRRTAADAGLAETIEAPVIDSGASSILDNEKVSADERPETELFF